MRARARERERGINDCAALIHCRRFRLVECIAGFYGRLLKFLYSKTFLEACGRRHHLGFWIGLDWEGEGGRKGAFPFSSSFFLFFFGFLF